MQVNKKIIFLLLFLLLSGCSTLLGITGADEGKRINKDWVEYHVTHPGLTIMILEPFTPDLLPISTVGKSTAPLKHTVLFGSKENRHKLEIIGKYKKELYLDGIQYNSLWSGDIVIKDGKLFINDRSVLEKVIQ